MKKELMQVLEEIERLRAEKRRERNRRKRIKEINGFYASTERGAKIHVTKIKGRYL